MKKSESIVEISKALTSFRKEVKQPLKDADNPFFKSKYVPLESVVESIDAVAPKHGLSYTQWALNDENGRVGVATMLLHESGEFIEYDPVFMTAEKNTPQGAGSLISYLKRYSLSAVFGITSDQDDDGNASSGNDEKKPKQDPINEKITTTFSQALQKQGSKEKLYEALEMDNEQFVKIFKKGNKKDKQELLSKLEGLK